MLAQGNRYNVLNIDAHFVSGRNTTIIPRPVGSPRTEWPRRVVLLSVSIVLVHLPLHARIYVVCEAAGSYSEQSFQFGVGIQRSTVDSDVRNVGIRKIDSVVPAFFECSRNAHIARKTHKAVLVDATLLVGQSGVKTNRLQRSIVYRNGQQRFAYTISIVRAAVSVVFLLKNFGVELLIVERPGIIHILSPAYLPSTRLPTVL